MPYNPDIHHRRSIRLRNYDYARAGAYFVTICVQYRECLFGEITVPAVGADPRVRPDSRIRPAHPPSRQINPGQAQGPAPTGPLSLPDVVQRYKSLTTNQYIQGVKRNGWPTFPGKLWQRNYWEHIIRDEPELQRIREYILNNPARWQEDALHPDQPPFPGETRESSPPYGHEVWMV